jgi:hypothetical protein
MRTITSSHLAIVLGAAVLVAANTASAGTECEGAGTTNGVLPRPSTCTGNITQVPANLVVSRGDDRWVAYLGTALSYDSTGTVLSETGARVLFSDRTADENCSGGPIVICDHQPFDINQGDVWDLSVRQDGLVTITNETWGGTQSIQGSCGSSNGLVFGTSDDSGPTALLVSFGVPNCQSLQ